ncbi:MAG: helix-turn-helix transcriptional regulator [Chloroflexota bacterium]
MAAGTTRDQILEILQRRETQTVLGLAGELGLAPTTVRRHLDILQRDGLVTFTEVRKGAGRPEFSFSLTEPGQEHMPKRYEQLLSGLVSRISRMSADEISGKSGAEVLDEALTELADDAIHEHGAAPGGGLEALVEVLRERDFAPEVSDIGDDGTVSISLMNCPYRSVAVDNPSICQNDTALMERMLQAPAERVACITRGDSCCTYRLKVGMNWSS